ncbi:hypothetical protein PoB_006015200 [Plakobranchus ocellatus]|uniref:Uncharacterized protein n=1 Tax=Plakobranchus ocellatus TaxID=259542 RepID=A0AAV4CP33_9GAST|nr:hypothetical protein PoB_006015200 [Plakobranchus ocellatus]
MSGKQGKRESTPEMQRSSLTVQSVDLRRYSGGNSSMKEHRHRQVVSLHGESSASEGKKSPGPHRSHRRSKDLNSSQESLSSPAPVRASLRGSSADVRESDEGSTKEGSPIHHSANVSRSNSPDKPLSSHNTFESPVHQHHHHHHPHQYHSQGHSHSLSDGGSSIVISGDVSGNNSGGVGGGLSPYERPRSALDSVDAVRDAEREKSFERSLDNILDKCCANSLDLNLSVDSWNSSANDSVKSPETQSQAGASKPPKGARKNRWYNSIVMSSSPLGHWWHSSYRSCPEICRNVSVVGVLSLSLPLSPSLVRL